MYDVLDVSYFIINYSNSKNYPISNLKLQKLLYFVQTYFLITKDEPCFTGDIVAWNIGPVVKKAFQKFVLYGSMNIPVIKVKKIPFMGWVPMMGAEIEWTPYMGNISKKDQERIQKVVDDLKNFTAADLLKAICSHTPFLDNFETDKDNIIPLHNIKDFYKKN